MSNLFHLLTSPRKTFILYALEGAWLLDRAACKTLAIAKCSRTKLVLLFGWATISSLSADNGHLLNSLKRLLSPSAKRHYPNEHTQRDGCTRDICIIVGDMSKTYRTELKEITISRLGWTNILVDTLPPPPPLLRGLHLLFVTDENARCPGDHLGWTALQRRIVIQHLTAWPMVVV